jgi:hypothetical protein
MVELTSLVNTISRLRIQNAKTLDGVTGVQGNCIATSVAKGSDCIQITNLDISLISASHATFLLGICRSG